MRAPHQRPLSGHCLLHASRRSLERDRDGWAGRRPGALLFSRCLCGHHAQLARPRTTAVVLGYHLPGDLPRRLFRLSTRPGCQLAPSGRRGSSSGIHFTFLAAATMFLAGLTGATCYWRALGWFTAGMAPTPLYGVLQLLDAARRGVPALGLALIALTGGSGESTPTGIVNGASVFRPNALTGDPDHLGIMLIVPLLVLSPRFLRLFRGRGARAAAAAMALIGFLLSWSGDHAVAYSGLLGLGVGVLAAAVPYRRFLYSGRSSSRLLLYFTARESRPVPAALLLSRVRDRASRRAATRRTRTSRSYSFIPNVLLQPSGARGSLNTILGLLRVRHRQVRLGPHLLLPRHPARRDRGGRNSCSRSSSSTTVFRRLHSACTFKPFARARGALARRPTLAAHTSGPAGPQGLYRRPRRDAASNAFYLTMQF